MSGKHTRKKNNKNFKLIFLLLLMIAVILLIGDKNFKQIPEKNDDIIFSEIDNHKTIEKEKLVLQSNYEENRVKKIIYIFKENILNEVIVFEKYNDMNEYSMKKENYYNRTDINVTEINDKDLYIYYKKLELRSDEGLSYDEIYSKYMGIIGAYQIIK